MSASGPKPETLEAKRASGQLPTALPVLAGGRPTDHELDRPPAHLDKWGKQAWREVVPDLVTSKLIDRVDVHALEAYALHMGRARALREAIEYVHWTTCLCPDADNHERKGCRLGTRQRQATLDEQFRAVTARGFTSNPLLSQEREALREARMMGELLGLNPVGRTRLVGKAPKRNAGLGGLTGNLPRPQLVPAVGDE